MSKDGVEVKVKGDPPGRPYDDLVNDWFMKWFPTSPIARSDECWQLLHRAVNNLKQRLKGEEHG
jgi:hypothetical protein